MSRRIFGLVLAASLLLTAGCGDKAETGYRADETFGKQIAAASPEPQPDSRAEELPAVIPGNGTFAMPYNSGYGWNPYTCIGMENRAVMQLVYEGLFALNPEFEPEWSLCTNYTVSDDGLSYVFELRSAAFSTGRTVTADDVVYSMEQAAGSELYSSRFSGLISGYYASEGNTVTVTLYEANDRLPCLLTFPIVPYGSSGEFPPGTGPFVRASESMLTANSQWWGGSLSFQTVSLYPSGSAEDTRDNFEIDNVQFVYNNPSASTAATYHCDYELWNCPGTVMQYIGFNFQAGVFQDEDVRRAVTRAIDRSSIAETAYHNFADSAVLPVSPASKMYYEDLVLAYDFSSSQRAMEELMSTSSFYLPQEKADALRQLGPDEELPETRGEEPPEDGETPPDDEEDPEDGEDGEDDEDGENDGDGGEDDEKKETAFNKIVFVAKSGNASRIMAAQEIADDLTRVGFTVELQVLEDAAYRRALGDGAFDIYYSEVSLKPDFDLREILLSEGDLYYGGIPERSNLRSLLYSALENNGNRYDLYKYIMEKGFLCPVMFVNNAVFTTRGVFADMLPAADNLFYQIENIQVNEN